MKYSGIDLHSNNSVVSVLDEEDRVVAEKRLPNDLTKILEFLAPWQSELAGVVVESTFNWYWLVDGLQAAGCKVHVAWSVFAPATAKRKGKGTPRTATSICHGPSSKRRTSHYAIAPKQNASTNERRRKRTTWWQSRHWRTNWRGHVSTF